MNGVAKSSPTPALIALNIFNMLILKLSPFFFFLKTTHLLYSNNNKKGTQCHSDLFIKKNIYMKKVWYKLN